MRKLPLIWLAAISLVASGAAVGQGCGSSDSTGGGGPGGAGGSAGATSTNPTAGGTTNTSTDNGGGGSTSSTTTSENGGSSSQGGSTPGSGGSGGGGGASCNGVELTVHNIASWCDVGVDGGAASTVSAQTVCVDASKKVPLTATGTGSGDTAFILDAHMWHHVDDSNGDTGVAGTLSHNNSESDETRTVGASGKACVWVCCPGKSNPTECDVGGAFVPTDPCAGAN
jgi:hypothetical protein